MRSFLALLTIFVLTISTAFSSVDPFNTYQWNRKNVLNNTGKLDKGPWYEWWYYKVVIPETKESFYFIYGVVNPWDKKQTLSGSRSYVGVGDFKNKFQAKTVLPVKSFQASYDETYVEVGENIATDINFMGATSENGNEVNWDISIEKKWTFNATSWATGKGITNIEWYPAQADAVCNGRIISNGKLYHLKDAPCYQDRNWGRSFPKWWTWIVSNKFEGHPDTALAIGGGRPKFLGMNIPFIEGVAIGLRHKGVDYAFRPNDFDIVKVDINFGKWEITAYDKNYKIEISAHAPKESFMNLEFMTPGGVIFNDYETLMGKVDIKLYKRSGLLFRKWTLFETLHSKYTGIEYGSHDLQNLNDSFNKKMKLQ